MPGAAGRARAPGLFLLWVSEPLLLDLGVRAADCGVRGRAAGPARCARRSPRGARSPGLRTPLAPVAPGRGPAVWVVCLPCLVGTLARSLREALVPAVPAVPPPPAFTSVLALPFSSVAPAQRLVSAAVRADPPAPAAAPLPWARGWAARGGSFCPGLRAAAWGLSQFNVGASWKRLGGNCLARLFPEGRPSTHGAWSPFSKHQVPLQERGWEQVFLPAWTLVLSFTSFSAPRPPGLLACMPLPLPCLPDTRPAEHVPWPQRELLERLGARVSRAGLSGICALPPRAPSLAVCA